MTNYHYKIYTQFTEFAKLIDQFDLENDDDYAESDRNHIYNRLRLPIKLFNGEKKKTINNLIDSYFCLKEEYFFSIIKSKKVSQIHTDTSFKKDQRLQRFCNLAFPLRGDFENRKTFWPDLNKKDSLEIFKNSYLNDDKLNNYSNPASWKAYVKHKKYQPVLLNTSEPHAAFGNGETLFAYITIPNKSYEECISLYNDISNSATI